MPQPIDELYARWKEAPDAKTTLALCDALHGSGRAREVKEVGDAAMKSHGDSLPILVSAARMCLAGELLHEAQIALVAAGKAAPLESHVYRLLGEADARDGAIKLSAGRKQHRLVRAG